MQGTLNYDIRMEPGVQTPEEKPHQKARLLPRFRLAAGANAPRHYLGFAARFVSGYSIQLVADIKALDGPSGVAKDVTDLHAWAEVYLPGAQAGSASTPPPACWPVKATSHWPAPPTPAMPPPITGGFNWLDDKEGKSAFDVHMSITRIHEDPRVHQTLHHDEQWKTIEALGHKIDADLTAGDVRLSMGGEPTFVSIDDMEGPEWNTEAAGQSKTRTLRPSYPAQKIRARRLALPPRLGQMVSRRVAAAAGPGLLLA